eukprot:1156221-Pelagomonas_calceolata.AAC.15
MSIRCRSADFKPLPPTPLRCKDTSRSSGLKQATPGCLQVSRDTTQVACMRSHGPECMTDAETHHCIDISRSSGLKQAMPGCQQGSRVTTGRRSYVECDNMVQQTRDMSLSSRL